MTTLQIKLTPEMNEWLTQEAKQIGISRTALAKTAIAERVGPKNDGYFEGNLFSASRDNRGEGLPLDSLLSDLKSIDGQ